MVICLERGANLHMAQLMALPLSGTHSLASVKFGLVLPFWYRLTWVVPEKGPLNGCMSLSFIPDLTPSFSAAFLFILQTFTVTSEHIRFYFLLFLF